MNKFIAFLRTETNWLIRQHENLFFPFLVFSFVSISVELECRQLFKWNLLTMEKSKKKKRRFDYFVYARASAQLIRVLFFFQCIRYSSLLLLPFFQWNARWRTRAAPLRKNTLCSEFFKHICTIDKGHLCVDIAVARAQHFHIVAIFLFCLFLCVAFLLCVFFSLHDALADSNSTHKFSTLTRGGRATACAQSNFSTRRKMELKKMKTMKNTNRLQQWKLR